MGLDMNLYKKMYIGNNYKEPDKQVKIDIEGVKQERVRYIIEDIGYWRKANHIHQWFIDNCASGVDECQDISVSREDLETLLKTVNEVIDASELIDGDIQNGSHSEGGKMIPNMEKGKTIKDPEVAMTLLPTQEGFFFGSTHYDQYYYEDLVTTKKILEEALADKDADDFIYSASW